MEHAGPEPPAAGLPSAAVALTWFAGVGRFAPPRPDLKESPMLGSWTSGENMFTEQARDNQGRFLGTKRPLQTIMCHGVVSQK